MTVRKAFVKDALASWIKLNEKISEFTEEEVVYALELENAEGARVGPRQTVVERLNQRLRGIRIEEIREELK